MLANLRAKLGLTLLIDWLQPHWMARLLVLGFYQGLPCVGLGTNTCYLWIQAFIWECAVQMSSALKILVNGQGQRAERPSSLSASKCHYCMMHWNGPRWIPHPSRAKIQHLNEVLYSYTFTPHLLICIQRCVCEFEWYSYSFSGRMSWKTGLFFFWRKTLKGCHCS